MRKKSLKSILIILVCTLMFTGCSNPDDVSNEVQSSESSNIEISFDENPDIYGQVKSVLGNEVVLEMAEIPEGGRGSGERTEAHNGASKGDSGERKQTVEFTGETKTIVIPVGIPIASVKQGEATQSDLNSIYEGTFLKIWLNEDDTVKSIVVQGR